MLTVPVGEHATETPGGRDLIFAITEVKHAVHVFDFPGFSVEPGNRQRQPRVGMEISADLVDAAEIDPVFFPALVGIPEPAHEGFDTFLTGNAPGWFRRHQPDRAFYAIVKKSVTPNCLISQPRKSGSAYAGFIGVTFAMILLPLFSVLGTVVLWCCGACCRF